MIKDWLSKCRECHPGHDASSCPTSLQAFVSQNHMTSFVDVQDMCLVEQEVKGVDYAALSYVWGPTPFFRNTSSNRENLRKHGGIGRYMDRVPRTIREAIILCQRVGIRFLWVDALCVTQDTYQLTEQIKNMNSVFSKASITIVAAAGSDADSGLPGFYQTQGRNSKPRRRRRMDSSSPKRFHQKTLQTRADGTRGDGPFKNGYFRTEW